MAKSAKNQSKGNFPKGGANKGPKAAGGAKGKRWTNELDDLRLDTLFFQLNY